VVYELGVTSSLVIIKVSGHSTSLFKDDLIQDGVVLLSNSGAVDIVDFIEDLLVEDSLHSCVDEGFVTVPDSRVGVGAHLLELGVVEGVETTLLEVGLVGRRG
jgi:hypothetical protein